MSFALRLPPAKASGDGRAVTAGRALESGVGIWGLVMCACLAGIMIY